MLGGQAYQDYQEGLSQYTKLDHLTCSVILNDIYSAQGHRSLS